MGDGGGTDDMLITIFFCFLECGWMVWLLDQDQARLCEERELGLERRNKKENKKENFFLVPVGLKWEGQVVLFFWHF